MRLIVALTGASGQIYGVKILEELKNKEVETYLIVSNAAEITLSIETDKSLGYLESLSDKFFKNDNIAAPISSGSFPHDGMIIAPCSMKTASSIAYGITDTLIARAADVTLKEDRKLLLLIRESPLHSGHLETLLKLSRMGAVIMPPVPAFYTMPSTIDEIVQQTVARVLEKFNVNIECKRWNP